MKKKGTILTLIGITAFLVLVVRGLIRKPPLDSGTLSKYEPRESHVDLNGSQRAEMIDVGDLGLTVYRYEDSSGLWQVALGKLPLFARNSRPLGILFTKPEIEEVSTPVYLCSYKGFSGKNTALDLSSNCSGEGEKTQSDPVGYVSAQIRTGFLMIVRCRSERSGFYNSLNPHCESPEDRLQASLGAIHIN